MTRVDRVPRHRVVAQLDRLADELADTFHGVFTPAAVTRFVYETYSLLDTQAVIKTHLISLTAHFAKQRLIDHGRVHGLVRVTVPQVLFVCVHNVGRSQMAAALLTHHALGRVNVRSAGSQPEGEVPTDIAAALSERGIALTEAYPKPLTDEVVRAADVVVSMGCGDACPVYPGKRYLDWPVADPIGTPLEQVRVIRDDLERRIRGLLAELLD